MFFRLAAMVTRRYCGAVSLNYKKVPEACSPGYKNAPMAGSPGYRMYQGLSALLTSRYCGAGSPGHIFVPRAGSPWYKGHADYRLPVGACFNLTAIYDQNYRS